MSRPPASDLFAKAARLISESGGWVIGAPTESSIKFSCDQNSPIPVKLRFAIPRSRTDLVGAQSMRLPGRLIRTDAAGERYRVPELKAVDVYKLVLASS